MFRLEIATDNAAFAEDPKGEIARILRSLPDRFEGNWRHYDAVNGTVRDANGSTVGQWQYTPED